jgi:MscS family membrane protein
MWLLATAVTLVVSVVTAASARAADETEAAAPALADQGPLPEWEAFVREVLAIDLFDIPLWRLGLSMLILLLGFTLRGFLLDKLLTPIELLFVRTKNEFDDNILAAVRRPLGWVVNLVAVYFALLILEPPESILTVGTLIMQTVGTVLVAWVVYQFIDVATNSLLARAEETESEMDDQLVPLVRRVVRTILFIIVGIAIIQQWGYDVTSLIAGLGIGGLAFALAAKPTLSNWFGSVMIFTDRPFKMGDWVRAGIGEGVVEEVGLRSTKIRTFSDTLITVPNADIATQPVENCSAMKMRRLRTHIGLVYGTTSEQMDQILAAIKQRILDDERIDDDTLKVFFDGFGASSLDVLVQCWMRTTAYDEFMEIKQSLLLDIMALVEEAGSAFAFPSQSVYLESPGSFQDPQGQRQQQQQQTDAVPVS